VRQLGCLELTVSDALWAPWDFPAALAAAAVEFQEVLLAGLAVCPAACWDSAFPSREDA